MWYLINKEQEMFLSSFIPREVAVKGKSRILITAEVAEGGIAGPGR